MVDMQNVSATVAVSLQHRACMSWCTGGKISFASRSRQAAAERSCTDMVCIVQVSGSRLGLDITRFLMVRGQS